MVRRFFDRMLRARGLSIAAILAFTALLGVAAARVKPDFAVEQFFPVYDQSKIDYDRFKKDFPYDDARAIVIVETGDLWTPAGIARIEALEKDLARIEGVLYTDGLTTIRDVVAEGDVVRTERLFTRPDLPQGEIARRRTTATTDPLFAWNLSPPPAPAGPALSVEGPAAGATTIRVMLLAEYAGKDETRMRFLQDARAVLAKHEHPGQRLVLSGIPVLRSRYNELINVDTGTLFPAVLVVILLLLLVSFRSIAVAGAALATIIFSVVWTYGAMGVLGYPLQVLTSITPIVVMIISISDTVHIVAHYKSALGRDHPRHQAIVDALTETAIPCLMTEVTIACGFLTLLGVNIVGIWQFGVATACGMMLTWLANMVVLPFALEILRPGGTHADAETAATRGFTRFVVWIEHVVTRRPRAVVGATAVILAGALVCASRVGTEYYSWDDLRKESALYREIQYADRVHGGLVPFAVFIEPKQGSSGLEPMLEPDAVALMDRLAAYLKTFPEVKAANSAADYWRKSFRLFAPELAAESGGLPRTRAAAAQLFTIFDDPKLTRDFVSHDRRCAAVMAMMPNLGSTRASVMLAQMDAHFDEESRATGYKITGTALFAILDDVYRTLVGGLAISFGTAIIVSFVVFCIVLRSWKLGLIGLVPNVLPMALTFAFMGLAGIQVKPTTVVVFSITLTISDDDTIQFLARFREIFLRRQAEGVADPHHAAVTETMREAGLPMFVTACAVSVGFCMLLFSGFLGLANLGLLVGVSLFTAIFGDMFLSPLLILKFRPRIGRAPATAAAPPPEPARASSPPRT